MFLTVASVTSESCQESDYDTAIDLVHHSHWSTTVVLVTPAGARLTVTREEMSTTRSYLEPDFDRLEATGDCVYVQHSEGAAPETSAHVRASIQLPPRVLTLTPDDFRRRALWKAGKLDLGELTFEDEERLHGDDAFEDGDGEQLCVPPEVVDLVLGLRKGSKVSLPDLPGLAEVRAADQAAQQRRWDNLAARCANRAALAQYELVCWREAQLQQLDEQLAQVSRVH
ncbi:hypothetical protein D3C71_22150 [compost metagenome]